MAHINEDSLSFFDSSAIGWLMRLLFFPTGIISLALAVIFLKRGPRTADNEKNVKKAARLRIRESSLRRLRSDEVKRVCKEYALPRKRQADLEKNGVLDGYKCGICMGGETKKRYLQLPCGHFQHTICMNDALEQDLATCPECGWSIKTLFDIKPFIPDEDVQ